MDPEKPSLSAALREITAEAKKSLGPHPAPDELAAYHAGELGEDEAEPLRNHLALCRQCAELLLDLADFEALEPPEGAPRLTEGDLDSAWMKLRSRLDQDAKPPAQPTVQPLAPLKLVQPPLEEPPRTPPPPLPVRERESAYRPVSPWALAASVLLAVGLGGSGYSWWMSRQPKGNVAVLDLYVDSTRGTETSESAPGNSSSFVLRLNLPEDATCSECTAEIRHDDRGDHRAIATVSRLKGAQVVNISLPAGSLSPGSYKAKLQGLDGGQLPGVTEYVFRVDKP